MKKNPNLQPSKKEPGGNALQQQPSISFPVIGIGSSAGGLEALELFLKNIAPPCGMAFVIVQHLDPTHKGILVELLQRVTSMPVTQVTDRLKIKPDHVYVIPPNQNMTILHGVLHLLDMVKPRGLRLPIDFFFRSMADDLQQHAIGVILSGMGSDGTLGLRAIKEKGGSVFIQDPASSKFDGMPRSAIDEGLADVVAPVEELPEKIITYLKHVPVTSRSPIAFETHSLSALEKVIVLLRSQTGHDFSLYKKNTVYRRIERRMGIHQIEKITDYVRFLQENPHEIELLFKELLIGVTSFFRDPAAWEALKNKAIPTILDARPAGGIIRAWVAGCSTGEEAYSLAIVFKEAIANLKPTGVYKLQIFATDLDKDAIEKARVALYPLNISADVTPDRLKRFFEKDDQGFRINREIREAIVFAPHNVIMDPPFTKLDILVCRNLLIYMEPELQKKLLPLFHYSLNPGGILFLGSAETVGSNAHLFKPLESQNRIFRQVNQAGRLSLVDFPASFVLPWRERADLPDLPVKAAGTELNLQLLTTQLLLQHFAAAAVLTNYEGDIIYISGRTGKYLEPAAGKANLNVFAMAREGLRYELNVLFNSVLIQKKEMSKKRLAVGTNGSTRIVDLTVKLVDTPDLLRGTVLIVFADVADKHGDADHRQTTAETADDSRLRLLEDELRQAKDEVFTIREEMQTSQEELKSTNEEMQSANEELQSTNEELTTSKEEMQSLNEELQTVNQELQSKVSDLLQANNDMKNLLNSTDIATLFLDDDLNVRRFTTRTATLIKLIPTDIGRPITDIVTDLKYPSLPEDARRVLHNLVYSERQVSTNDGRWFTVKIMPYRTQENRIDGLVITFTDITNAKQFEQNLRQIEETCRFLIETMPFGSMLQDSDGKILMVNRETERMSGMSMEELSGKTLAELRWKLFREDGSELSPADYPSTIALLSGQPVRDVVLRMEQPYGTAARWIRLSAIPHLPDGSEKPRQVYTTIVEINAPN
ncbi:chemotaxis protein CheB [Chlorobaculum limnaeum]|uniref:protein-glutamate O-methyltransferase n=1 Tax=Chlorobaculum limnaeum TaxID=274537 RepID=A0A1D8D387_CHLLM|nr:chemotaxis protein CheB [Chlorobaculum limnaeum]AOS85081.1 chemotaxis protein CheB [Chlorobaculum limnaeum]